MPDGRVVALDYETDGLSPYDGARPFLAGMEDENGNIIIERPGIAGWGRVRELVEDAAVVKVCHNAKFEWKMSVHNGMRPAGEWRDTMGMAALVNEYVPSLSLGGLSDWYLAGKRRKDGGVRRWLDQNMDGYKKVAGREPNYSDAPDKLMLPYLENDLDCTMMLNWRLWPEVRNNFMTVFQVESDLMPVVAAVEDRGVEVDVEYCYRTARALKRSMDAKERQMRRMLGGTAINPASPRSVAGALSRLGVIPSMDAAGLGKKPASMDHDSLKSLRHPLAGLVLEWRTMAKMRNTYLLPFTQKAVGDVLHCNFWQFGGDNGVKTGRLSSSGPNMQNIPVRTGSVVRNAIVPRRGFSFVFLDFSQMEMVLFAHYAGDKACLEAIRRGADLHTVNARRIFGVKFSRADADKRAEMRQTAKTLNFSLLYGMGIHRMAAKMGIDLPAAVAMREAYFREVPMARDLMRLSQAELHRKGYVEDVFGKRYHVPPELSYKAVNAKIQGTAAMVMKRAMVAVHKALSGTGAGIVLTIHDELVLECPSNDAGRLANLAAGAMEDRTTFLAPLSVKTTIAEGSWGNKATATAVRVSKTGRYQMKTKTSS